MKNNITILSQKANNINLENPIIQMLQKIIKS